MERTERIEAYKKGLGDCLEMVGMTLNLPKPDRRDPYKVFEVIGRLSLLKDFGVVVFSIN